jgi:hypothetical protein
MPVSKPIDIPKKKDACEDCQSASSDEYYICKKCNLKCCTECKASHDCGILVIKNHPFLQQKSDDVSSTTTTPESPVVLATIKQRFMTKIKNSRSKLVNITRTTAEVCMIFLIAYMFWKVNVIKTSLNNLV